MAEVQGRDVSISGMTEPEAREFHSIFVTSFIIFTVIAVVAHFLVWMWRPWLPGPNGYKTALEGAHHLASLALTALS
ncbi:light-harvesting antenna LH1, beta subunit [Beijerinckia sp. L45]|uniref:light-harvesting antenna LH1, beta subunit n=1 Tax=Beijerinckia sp. L45 TaxID=1641855 RepID=UPI00131B7899|nr:light-harvesting antenna LH1, beta subunit [Beijerinckia sp. L45]